ncbi:MAG: DUF1127 domain-containing protein [Alphaproteobacteria bacterium]|nr:DUF1127 domain-containing protein [Alphaproteobacteria bacterium]
MAYVDQLSGAQIAAHAAYSQATAGNLIAGALLDGFALLRGWLSTRKATRELRLLDAHLLNDIGLDKSDIPAQAPASFIGLNPRI